MSAVPEDLAQALSADGVFLSASEVQDPLTLATRSGGHDVMEHAMTMSRGKSWPIYFFSVTHAQPNRRIRIQTDAALNLGPTDLAIAFHKTCLVA